MYHTHFGLERGLFGEGIAADSAVFRTPRHDRLIAQFKLALASPSSSIVLKGPAGVGKTTVTSTALRASSTRLALAWLGGMATNSAELLELILVELGINTLRTTRIERLQLWRQFQGEMRATDSRLFLIVERTEDLSHEVLHALDQLTAPDASGNSGANLVLLGHPGIEEHLAPSLLDSLRQRLRLHAELDAFSEAELQDYLRHQVACAGGHFDRIFAPGTVAALHRYTRGVARLVNTLCDSALEVAAAQQATQLTAELVATTAVTQLKLAGAAAAPRTPSVTTTPAANVAAPAALARAALAPATLAPAASPERVPAPGAAPAAAPPSAPAPTTRALATPAGGASSVAAPMVATPALGHAAGAAAPAATAAPAAAQPSPVRLAAQTAEPEPIVAQAPPPAEPPIEMEYDGSATDVADVALADFPVLTDAVELPGPFAKRAAPAAAALGAAAAASPPPKPAGKPAGRIETAYVAKPPAPAAQPSSLPDPGDDDVLRQTQSMRAIAVAKSIDDLSELDAETLFGDAGLDLVSAALASAADWPDDELDAVAADAAPPPRVEPETKKAPPPADDPFDFFGLGQDAPLELIDDSAPRPSERAPKAAVR